MEVLVNFKILAFDFILSWNKWECPYYMKCENCNICKAPSSKQAKQPYISLFALSRTGYTQKELVPIKQFHLSLLMVEIFDITIKTQMEGIRVMATKSGRFSVF